ncbi:MAG TPA: antA/AntB antirepressor family protein [Accumulibacter sp.]|uniref:antA/AntB antirepressor family protein n=1 Tax=Accumulibacter sp. TaxID=2053492 RepID=UPI002C9BADCA|nr:antA/AntB antirepressor family protein [Accumulibacter sp.]HNG88224.1 antA/AntB antirepressor family protein [Accumulibacter sp.]HNK04428.1 antA/AntB antirepressor family protein [Accumulibacter sp.]
MTTTDLVPVFAGTLAGQPAPLCNARDLHAALGVGDRLDQWIRRRIEEYGFIDGEDSCTNSCKTRGRPATDYHISLDMAKELAIVENNEVGRRIRRYFIALEKKQGTTLPLQAPQTIAPTFACRRWLLVVDPHGGEMARCLDPEHFLTKIDEFPTMIRDPAFDINGGHLAEIIHARADRLAGKLAGRARRAI